MTQRTRAQLNVSVGLLLTVVCTGSAAAQQRLAAPPSANAKKPEWQQASIASGKVQGTVRDERGQVVDGVRISAVGTTTAVAWTDRTGHFALTLPSGEYVVRAQRDGYASSYGDLVMVRSSTAIDKTITVTRQVGARPVMVAGVANGPVIPPSAIEPDPDHPHDETAWQLRHLKRPVLRDIGGVTAAAARAQNFKPTTKNFLDWAFTNSARLATSFFNQSLTGQVNFVTTSAVDSQLGWSQSAPRSVAYLSLSAPVGSLGDWRVRGSMAATDLSSWVVLGEFTARQTRTHAFSLGMGYSTQTYADPAQVAFAADAATTRAVGGLYGDDRWRIADGLELDYGLRWDRYSYIARSPNLLSPHGGVRLRLNRQLTLVGNVAQQMVAPGSTEFLPPTVAGPWLPPERTFASLSASGQFRAERVRHFDAGIEQALGANGALQLRRFRQEIDDQTATIFGLETDGTPWTAGHYYVASIGSATVDGWSLRAAGTVSSRLSGSVEYTIGRSQWLPGGSARRVDLVAPSAVRRGVEHVQDLTTSVDVAIPESDTRVSLMYRVESAFSRSTGQALPGGAARFNMQINQALPFQPLRGSRLEVLVAVSNLFRDLRQPGSLFDELLTVSPPTRLLGGVQLRF